ncbi:integral membrane protein [Botrytis cinerea]
MSTGLLPAPPGITPNFSTSALSSTQVAYIIAYTITLGLASSTLGIRLYTRISIMNSFGLDDIAIILSYACSIAYFAITIDCMRYGFGRHLWEVTGEQMAHYLTKLSPMVATYAWAPAFTKLSILILLYRLNPSKYFRIGCCLVAGIIITYTLAISLIIAIPCVPTNPENGECLNQCGLWQAIFNILTDAAILLLPSHMLYLLKLPLRQKLAVASIFSTGILCVQPLSLLLKNCLRTPFHVYLEGFANILLNSVIIICIVRITYIMALQDNPDVLYTQGRAAVWSSVEINIGIFCNTLVVLRPFIRQYFPGLFSSHLISDDARQMPDPEANLESRKRRIGKLRKKNSLTLTTMDHQMNTMDKQSGIMREYEVSVERSGGEGASSVNVGREKEREDETESMEGMIRRVNVDGSDRL